MNLVARCVEADLLILKYFNNSTFFNVVCVSWLLKCVLFLSLSFIVKYLFLSKKCSTNYVGHSRRESYIVLRFKVEQKREQIMVNVSIKHAMNTRFLCLELLRTERHTV